MEMKAIQMVDLQGQYRRLKPEIDMAVQQVLDDACFINGPHVSRFQQELADYTGSNHVIPCGNGTDALQIALMALNLQPGDEVITVPFTFVSTVEVMALLGLKPVFVDVRWDTFTMDVDRLESVVTERTKAIVPVHLFGQCADMEKILTFAEKYNLFVVEDACQAIGTTVRFSDGTVKQAGTMGDIGCMSFFPSKNLGCFGDGGALLVQDAQLAASVRQIASHGSSMKYYHKRVGVNSRLDSLQAAILSVKLKHLDEFLDARRCAALFYDNALANNSIVELPTTATFSSHVYHQYTLKCEDNFRDVILSSLKKADVPVAIYYPVPLHLQEAYLSLGYALHDFPVSEKLASSVLSLPMHTELDEEQLNYIVEHINCI